MTGKYVWNSNHNYSVQIIILSSSFNNILKYLLVFDIYHFFLYDMTNHTGFYSCFFIIYGSVLFLSLSMVLFSFFRYLWFCFCSFIIYGSVLVLSLSMVLFSFFHYLWVCSRSFIIYGSVLVLSLSMVLFLFFHYL